MPGCASRPSNEGLQLQPRDMQNKLERRYGHQHLHFITCSCYRRRPFLRTARKRDVFLKILDEVRTQYQFWLIGYVVMPEHIHLLISEPESGTPSTVMQILKQRVGRALLAQEGSGEGTRAFWQRRFYDFNVWSKRRGSRS